MNFYSVEERQNMLRVVITRPGTGPEFSFRTRYPARPEICLLVPPLIHTILYVYNADLTTSRMLQIKKRKFNYGH